MALFAGAGGGILGGKLLGWRTVCAVEWEPYPASVLCARQNDGLLPPFPIWDDVQTFDGKPWAGIVDVVSGGFPCQDISAAGKGAGIDGERSGMWREMARIIHEVRPKFVFVENSPMLTSRGLGTVLGDLAEMGFDAKWGVLGADNVGAPHQRDRIWIVGKNTNAANFRPQTQRPEQQTTRIARVCEEMGNAYNNGQFATEVATSVVERSNTSQTWAQQASQSPRSSEQHGQLDKTFANTKFTGLERWENIWQSEIARSWSSGASIGGNQWWASEPDVGRVAHGVDARVDRLKAIGNGQVPLCAATAWRILSQ